MAHLLVGLIAGVFLGTDVPEPDGEAVYRARCLSCHQADGHGVPFFQPSIVKSAWLEGPPGELARLILFGAEWSNYENAMPGAEDLDDGDIAALMTYLRARFTDKTFAPAAAETVNAARAHGPLVAP